MNSKFILKLITFTNLIIEDGPQDLKLTYKANHILGKFVCNRILTNTSSFTMTISGVTPAVKPPLILETNISLLKLLRSDYLYYCLQFNNIYNINFKWKRHRLCKYSIITIYFKI